LKGDHFHHVTPQDCEMRFSHGLHVG